MATSASWRGRAGPHAWLMESLAVGADHASARGMGLGRLLLGLAVAGLGVRGLACGDFAGVWQRIPIAYLPAQGYFAYATALVELVTGIGILLPRIAKVSAAVMTGFTLLWMVLLKLPAVVYVPSMEAVWLGTGEVAVIVSGAWVVLATLGRSDGEFVSGRNGIRWARLLFVLALPAIGLSHFFYTQQTVALIPAWLPWRNGWAYLTGAADILAAAGVLFAVLPRLAATAEAAMLWIITLLVWLPGVIAVPSESAWTPFLMSSAIAAGASVVADSYRGTGWWTAGTAPTRAGPA
jgi:uncharacterized membrane protein